jgi:hypothetical protein
VRPRVLSERSRFIPIAALLAAAIASGCSLTDGDLKLDYQDYAPAQLSDGWQLSTVEAEGFDRQEIDRIYRAFYSESRYPTAHSLLIVRHGRLVAEAYCRDLSELRSIRP